MAKRRFGFGKENAVMGLCMFVLLVLTVLIYIKVSKEDFVHIDKLGKCDISTRIIGDAVDGQVPFILSSDCVSADGVTRTGMTNSYLLNPDTGSIKPYQ